MDQGSELSEETESYGLTGSRSRHQFLSWTGRVIRETTGSTFHSWGSRNGAETRRFIDAPLLYIVSSGPECVLMGVGGLNSENCMHVYCVLQSKWDVISMYSM